MARRVDKKQTTLQTTHSAFAQRFAESANAGIQTHELRSELLAEDQLNAEKYPKLENHLAADGIITNKQIEEYCKNLGAELEDHAYHLRREQEEQRNNPNADQTRALEGFLKMFPRDEYVKDLLAAFKASKLERERLPKENKELKEETISKLNDINGKLSTPVTSDDLATFSNQLRGIEKNLAKPATSTELSAVNNFISRTLRPLRIDLSLLPSSGTDDNSSRILLTSPFTSSISSNIEGLSRQLVEVSRKLSGPSHGLPSHQGLAQGGRHGNLECSQFHRARRHEEAGR